MGVSLVRTLILYIFVVFAVRLMGKRQVGELQPSELVVTILISELAAIPMQDFGTPIVNGIIPILTLVTAEMLLSFIMLKSTRLRFLFTGKPSVLIRAGHPCQKEMGKLRCTIDDLMEELRLLGIRDISEVETAIMETNGKLSIFKKTGLDPATPSEMNIKTEPKQLLVPLIMDGKLLKDNLPLAGLGQDDIKKALKTEQTELENIFFMYQNSDGGITTIKREIS